MSEQLWMLCEHGEARDHFVRRFYLDTELIEECPGGHPVEGGRYDEGYTKGRNEGLHRGYQIGFSDASFQKIPNPAPSNKDIVERLQAIDLLPEGGELVWCCQTHRAEAFMGSDAVMGWVGGQPPLFCVLAEALGEQYHQWCRMVERFLIPLSKTEVSVCGECHGTGILGTFDIIDPETGEHRGKQAVGCDACNGTMSLIPLSNSETEK